MIVKKASARYQGLGKEGKGEVSTESGALSNQHYGFNTRFEGAKGTNPEELIAAAHASCFTMATSFALARAGYNEGELETSCAISLDKEGDGFVIRKSELKLSASIPNIDAVEFGRIADDAKANCPVSKLLNCEITLERSLRL